MDGAGSNWILSCRGFGIVVVALAFRSRMCFTMVVLAAIVDLEEQALPWQTANAQSIINMLIRKCISLMAIGKMVVAVEAVEVDFIGVILY